MENSYKDSGSWFCCSDKSYVARSRAIGQSLIQGHISDKYARLVYPSQVLVAFISRVVVSHCLVSLNRLVIPVNLLICFLVCANN